MNTSKITPFLWFDKNLKEITSFYKSVFPSATITSNGELSDTPSGNVEMATMEILGQKLSMMTAGPMFKFNEAISFVINCDNQEEIDYYWNALTANGGQESQCGWLKDKYGLSWQIVPSMMNELMSSGDKEKTARITQAFLKMKKFDIGYEMIENEMKWMGEINYIMLKEYGYERLKSTLETIFSSGFDILFLDSIEDVVSKLKVYADMSQNEAENYVIDLMDKAADGKDNKGVHTTTLAIQQVTKGGEFKGDNKLKHMTTGMLHAYKDEKGERYLTFSKNRRCGGHQEKRLYYGLNDKKEIEFNLALFTQVEEEAKFMKQEQSKILEASKDFWSVVEKPAVIDLISVLNETSEEEEVGIEILDEA